MGSKINIPLRDSIATRMLLMVLGLYLMIAIVVAVSMTWMEYSYQKENIIEDLNNIENAFENGLAVSLWGLDQEALSASVKGLLKVPTLVGVKVITNEGLTVAMGGIVTEHKDKGKVGAQVDLSGLSDLETIDHDGEEYNWEMFEHQFPIVYKGEGKDVPLGQAVIYSDSSVIYRRMKLQETLQVVNIVLTLLTFALALFWAINRYLRAPLGSLASATKNVTLENLDSFEVKIKSSGRDELKLLEESFNSMIKNLHQSIVEREYAEEELKKSHVLLNSILKEIPDPVFLKDLEGRYLLVNDATLKAMGKPKAEVIGKSDVELFPEQSAEVLNKVDKHVLESGEEYMAEERIETAYGDSIWLANKSPFRDENNNIIGLVGVSKNITELKESQEEKLKLEVELRQAHKMEAIGTLAGGIAHDFNNILGAILGFTELAIYEMPANTSNAKNHLDEVLKAGGRAKELVQHILSFSRKEAQDRTPIQPGLVVNEALKLLRASIPATIEIQQSIDPCCGNILAESTQIHQVVMNLCTNAAQAMDETGGVLEVDMVSLQADANLAAKLGLQPGKFIRLSVKDSGMGIDQLNIDRIFDPYFTTKGVGKGSGMGLAVVSGIIKSHEGCITVESKPGEGTTFQVYFPENDAVIQEESIDVAPVPGGSEKILIVDDEESLLTLMAKRLELLGYQVTTTASSMEALELFRSQPDQFNVVISDQTMPELTGDQLAKHLIEIRSDIPIIICSGYSSKIDAEKAGCFGIKAFLMKPVNQRELADTIRQVLDSRPS